MHRSMAGRMNARKSPLPVGTCLFEQIMLLSSGRRISSTSIIRSHPIIPAVDAATPSRSSGEASSGSFCSDCVLKNGQSRCMYIESVENDPRFSSAAFKNSSKSEVKRSQSVNKRTGWDRIGGSITPPRPNSFQLRLGHATSADHLTPWLQICPRERSGPPLSHRDPLLAVSRRLSPVVASPSLQRRRLRISNSPDGHTLRRAQRRLSVSGCTLNALPSMSTLTQNCLINSTSGCSAMGATSFSRRR